MMKTSLFVALYFVTVLHVCSSGNAPIFSLQTCEGGCKSTNDCPENAACIPVLGQNCGVCLCTVKYTAAGDKCVPADSVGIATTTTTISPVIVNGPSVEQIPTRFSSVIITPTPPPWPPLQNFTFTPSHPVTTTQPRSQEFTCQINTKCPDVNSPSIKDDNPFSVKSTKINTTDCNDFFPTIVNCPNLANGGQCAGAECLNVSADKSYCICQHNKVSPTCQEDKTGDCLLATGATPNGSEARVGKRFVHKRDHDYGAILGRHYANSLKDCIRLCQWATPTQCHSINYGPINGRMVCELVTIMAKPNTILFSWLVDDPAWTYFCCFNS